MSHFNDFNHFVTIFEENVIGCNLTDSQFRFEEFSELFLASSTSLEQLHTFYKTHSEDIINILNSEPLYLQVFSIFKLYVEFLENQLELSTPVQTRPIIAKTNPSLIYKLNNDVAPIKAPDINILASPKQDELRKKMRSQSSSAVVTPPSLSAESTQSSSSGRSFERNKQNMKSLVDDELQAILNKRKRLMEE